MHGPYSIKFVMMYFACDTFLVFKFAVSCYATVCIAGKFDGFILEIMLTVERNSTELYPAHISWLVALHCHVNFPLCSLVVL
jgi:hypothetical protein